MVTVSRPVSGGVSKGLSTGDRGARIWPVTCGFVGWWATVVDRCRPLFRGLPRPGRGLTGPDQDLVWSSHAALIGREVHGELPAHLGCRDGLAPALADEATDCLVDGRR